MFSAINNIDFEGGGKMEKKVLKKYIMIVFSDGSIETHEITEETSRHTSLDHSKLSSRISQILKVLDEISTIRDNGDMGETEIFTTAIKNVANELGVENTSVVDKLTRQLGETAESIRVKIFEAYRSNETEELKETILKNVSIRNKEKDADAVNYYFDNMFK